MDNNETLAKYFMAEYPQIIIVGKIAWKHLPNGDWFIVGNLP